MRHSLIPMTAIALLCLAASTSLATEKDVNGAATETKAASMESMEARCAADTSLKAEFQHCIARLSTKWQQSQFDAVQPAPKVKPDAVDVELDWTPQQGSGLTEELHLSLAGE